MRSHVALATSSFLGCEACCGPMSKMHENVDSSDWAHPKRSGANFDESCLEPRKTMAAKFNQFTENGKIDHFQ